MNVAITVTMKTLITVSITLELEAAVVVALAETEELLVEETTAEVVVIILAMIIIAIIEEIGEIVVIEEIGNVIGIGTETAIVTVIAEMIEKVQVAVIATLHSHLHNNFLQQITTMHLRVCSLLTTCRPHPWEVLQITCGVV